LRHLLTQIKILNGRFAVSTAPPSEGDLRALAEDGYKAVVNLRCQDEADQPLAPDREGEVVASLGLEYCHLPVAGGTISDELVDEFRASVEALPKPVLVHCASGKRAGAFTIMHLASQQGMSGDATLQKAADMGFVCDEPALENFVRNYVDRAQD